MRIGFSTGYSKLGNYWGQWLDAKQVGGSERIVIEVASALAAQEHQVQVRLPYDVPSYVSRDVRYVGSDFASGRFDVLFCFDDFERRDQADATALVTSAYAVIPHTQFDHLIFLSRAHADFMGFRGSPVVGGGVSLEDYKDHLPRIPRRVICTSSPDRCPAADIIGRGFDFIRTYRPVGGLGHEYTRSELLGLQKSARVHIYPLAPTRPSDFFSMSTLESMAAGTPVVLSDADAMPELWGDAAIILPRPIDYGIWSDTIENLLSDPVQWRHLSQLGRKKAEHYSWPLVAQRYLDVARS